MVRGSPPIDCTSVPNATPATTAFEWREFSIGPAGNGHPLRESQLGKFRPREMKSISLDKAASAGCSQTVAQLFCMLATLGGQANAVPIGVCANR